MPTIYRFHTKIRSIKEHWEPHSWRIVTDQETGAKIHESDQRSLGWFVTLDGSRESMYVGDTKPDLTVGQDVTVTIAPR